MIISAIRKSQSSIMIISVVNIVDVLVCSDMLSIFSQRYLSHLFSQSARDDTPPQPGSRRPRGRRHLSWLLRVSTDLNLPALDALNLALDRTSWRAVTMASGLCGT